MRFSEMHYERPSLEAALASARALAEKARAVASDEEMTALYWEIDKAGSAWSTMACLANIH